MEFEALFARWRAEFPFQTFVRDGIVNPDTYRRILFVLRDKNCGNSGTETEDLREELRRDGGGWRTWNNAARWTIALLDGEKPYPRHISRESRVSQAERIAAINLKKEGGENRTDGSALLEAVQKQHELIWEEIQLCRPNIIICCGLPSPGIQGTGELLKEYVLPDSSGWRSIRSASLDRDWRYYLTGLNSGEVPVVSFCHPQVTHLQGGLRGHQELFAPLYRDMLLIRERFALGK